jgi:ABC-type sugar transport system ATPase subunit
MDNKFPLLELKNIHKGFPGVKALDGVDLDLLPGEVHVLFGENGAGKSTLIKILTGIYKKDEGEIKICGEDVEIQTPLDARDKGLTVIHQELALVPYLSISDNIFLGHEVTTKSGLIDYNFMEKKTQKYLDEFNIHASPDTPVVYLSIAQQQMVEIIRAISFDAKIIAMDEPTSSLADREVNVLFDTIRQLKSQGIGIIFISHRLNEVLEIGDRISVLRDGKYIGTKVIKETSSDEIISMTIGRSLSQFYERTPSEIGEVILSVKDLCSEKIKNVNFDLRKGEILGFAGLVGAGRTDTMKAIMGIDKITSGSIKIDNKIVDVKSTSQMIGKGLGFVPEDRRTEGMFPMETIKFNILIKALDKIIKFIHVDRVAENKITQDYMEKLAIKAPSSETITNNLSGGNQQKVIISSWLVNDPEILIMDEPTRGIDVGAKREIYGIMDALVHQGVSIIMVSSDMPEIINLCDRVVVMCEGTTTAILDKPQATQEKILECAVKI